MDLRDVKTPVAVISGTRSSIPMDALALKEILRDKDRYFEVEGADHGSILTDEELSRILIKILVHR